eukprot:TRINITY_DN52224_c0_g1_i1.p1 TRINITY_DN52224_c0_g1~~TRINITY_DN52224_c0_g1_i1.p1  ORF type:complete len:347 (+),score=28.47 TRINITY_DN52224_c0_g1_i1:74-1114(+)
MATMTTKKNYQYVHNPYQSQPVPEKTTRRPLCLDYLHGECSNKRARCSFYHPDVTNWPAGVCWAYFATGFCKYGVQCELEHPNESECANVADIAMTRGMTREQRTRGIKLMKRRESPTEVVVTPAQQLRALLTTQYNRAGNCTSLSTEFEDFNSFLEQTTYHNSLAAVVVDMLLEFELAHHGENIPTVQSVAKQQHFGKFLIQLLAQHAISPTCQQFCENLLVAICSRLKQELTAGSNRAHVRVLMCTLWLLFQHQSAGDKHCHLCALRTMCSGLSMDTWNWLLEVVDCVGETQRDSGCEFGCRSFAEWRMVFLQARTRGEKRKTQVVPLHELVELEQKRLAHRNH